MDVYAPRPFAPNVSSERHNAPRLAGTRVGAETPHVSDITPRPPRQATPFPRPLVRHDAYSSAHRKAIRQRHSLQTQACNSTRSLTDERGKRTVARRRNET